MTERHTYLGGKLLQVLAANQHSATNLYMVDAATQRTDRPSHMLDAEVDDVEGISFDLEPGHECTLPLLPVEGELLRNPRECAPVPHGLRLHARNNSVSVFGARMHTSAAYSITAMLAVTILDSRAP